MCKSLTYCSGGAENEFYLLLCSVDCGQCHETDAYFEDVDPEVLPLFFLGPRQPLFELTRFGYQSGLHVDLIIAIFFPQEVDFSIYFIVRDISTFQGI